MYKLINKKICNDLTREICDYLMVSKEDVKMKYNNVLIDLFLYFMWGRLKYRRLEGIRYFFI
jgi:hypothetical protein